MLIGSRGSSYTSGFSTGVGQMQYQGEAGYQHDQPQRVGVLLTNLGTPDAPTPSALRRYLKEFLWDPRVVEMPRLLWWLILHGVILRIRPRRSAKAYAKVWGEEGSPLLSISRQQEAALKKQLQAKYGGQVVVELAMRYGSPSIADAMERLRQANVRQLLLLPLYPQYSCSTTASTLDALTDILKQRRWVPELRTINQYHDHPDYIAALVDSIRDAWAGRSQPEKLLFSFHGTPMRYRDSGDPYYCMCLKTARLVAEKMNLSDEQWAINFQSRFGREPWLQPYTHETLAEWGKAGIKSVDVICPGFSADCLETIEEIDEENREIFLEAGGQTFHYIPALNSRDMHVTALQNIVESHLQGWLVEQASDEELQQRKQRAVVQGAKS